MTEPPRENDLIVCEVTLGTVGTLLRPVGTGVVKLEIVGRSGTAGTGFRKGRIVPILSTGRLGTAGTGSGKIF